MPIQRRIEEIVLETVRAVEPPTAPWDSDSELIDNEEEFFGLEEVAPRDFPSYQIESVWNAQERENAVNAFFRMEYRLKWIFYRQEKEGVNRTRFINPFSPEDFDLRVAKAPAPHRMNTATSTFYDWNLGGTDFIMRLERLDIKETPCLRCHFIHKHSKKELCVQDRIYEDGVFKVINITWARSE